MDVTRIDLLGVPVDVVKPEDLENVLFDLNTQAGTKQIVFLSVWGLLRARRNDTFMQCLKGAALVLPVSKSLIRGAAFLKKPVPVRYNQFSTLISLLGSLETRYKSLYLLGGRKRALLESERNLRTTFPGLQIVGRYVGYFPKTMEKDLVSAIYKSNPTMLLISEGVKNGECWAYERRNQFASSFVVYYKDALAIFSSRKKRVSQAMFDRGHEIWNEILQNPIKVFLIFPYLWYIFLIVCCRIFKK